jgi:DnaJ-class molecular chaperone
MSSTPRPNRRSARPRILHAPTPDASLPQTTPCPECSGMVRRCPTCDGTGRVTLALAARLRAAQS